MSVTGCSGNFSVYRRVAIQNFIHKWANDMFLGKEFNFCTDRRLNTSLATDDENLYLRLSKTKNAGSYDE